MSELQSKHCLHGEFNETTKRCDCFEGWASAGITDTIDFLEGVCEQYHCQSDEMCQKVLGIPHATCPVKNWNCYCGWSWAFKYNGHGWETPRKHGGGECMGVMYTLSVSATEFITGILRSAWIVFLSFAIVCAPFGRNRANCDHHRPSMSNWLRKLVGQPSTCRGECVLQQSYTVDRFMDDIAWTAFMLELGVWFYIFASMLLIVFLFIWSVVLWAAIVIILVIAAVVGICMACGEAGAADCGACGEGPVCVECCPVGAGHEPFVPSNTDAFYFNVSPSTPVDDCCQGDGEHSSSCCKTWCCCLQPFAWLIYVFPVLPENLWGGIVGRYIMGTHHMTPAAEKYRGNHPVVEFLRMGWRNQNHDLHSDESWRAQVRDFILGGPLQEQNGSAGPPVQQTTADQERTRYLRSNFTRRGFSQMDYQEVQQTTSDYGSQEIVAIGRAHAVKILRPFDEADNCIPSSFEDYLQNQCWICAQPHEEWDLWVSCHHMFCSECSTQMLLRRMPCPLCRVASSVVKRGFMH